MAPERMCIVRADDSAADAAAAVVGEMLGGGGLDDFLGGNSSEDDKSRASDVSNSRVIAPSDVEECDAAGVERASDCEDLPPKSDSSCRNSTSRV